MDMSRLCARYHEIVQLHIHAEEVRVATTRRVHLQAVEACQEQDVTAHRRAPCDANRHAVSAHLAHVTLQLLALRVDGPDGGRVRRGGLAGRASRRRMQGVGVSQRRRHARSVPLGCAP
jgi:hypothetical protein